MSLSVGWRAHTTDCCRWRERQPRKRGCSRPTKASPPAMSARRRWALGLAWLALLSVQVSDCVHITRLSVPAVVEHNTNSTAILDCEYDLDGDEVNLLIVKWYFNGDMSKPVYQWVSGRSPSSAGALKGRVHLGHVASPDPLMKHRALSITNPTIELGGEYICNVFTDAGVDNKAKNMIVYAPASTMNLTEDKPSPTSVNISCLVEGVYPAPKLELFATQQGKKDSRKPIDDVTEWHEAIDESLFDAMVHATIEDSSLDGSTEFECVMSIPDTPYTEKKVITYSSGDIVSPPSSVPNETQIAATPLSNQTDAESNDLAVDYGPDGVLEGAVLAASKAEGAASRSVVLSSALLDVCLLLLAISLHR